MTDAVDATHDRSLGAVTVLTGPERGKYPSGSSLLVRGGEETVLIDPSLELHRRGSPPAPVDRVLLSHAHEDHMSSLYLFPDASVHVHRTDLEGARSLEGLLAIYGLDGDAEAAFTTSLVEDFNIEGRPDAVAFDDGERFDLGGGQRITVVHLPGHTGGHSGFLVEPDGVFFIADVDLTSFGPYYGDAASSLDAFERSLERCGEVDARWYVTFHHKGLVEGRDEFLPALRRYADRIARRDDAIVAYLTEPRTIEDLVRHRFVYRPHVDEPFVDSVERRTVERHLAKLQAAGRVVRAEPDRYAAA